MAYQLRNKGLIAGKPTYEMPDFNMNMEDLESTFDVGALFKHLNNRYFNGELRSFTVQWNRNLKKHFGTTLVKERLISISTQLHKVLTVGDVVGTLLHECVHAEKFLQGEVTWHEHDEAFKDRLNSLACQVGCVLRDCTDLIQDITSPYVWECHKCHRELHFARDSDPKDFIHERGRGKVLPRRFNMRFKNVCRGTEFSRVR